MLTPKGSTRATVILSIITVLFAGVIVHLVTSAFARREAPTYNITPLSFAERTFERNRDTVTVDAQDERQWAFFDFERRSIVLPPDTASWDIAFRRFEMISAAGARDMGEVPYDSIVTVPRTGFVNTTWGSDTVNAALESWYDYSFTTHLLTPQARVFVLRTQEAGAVKLQLLSYYCLEMVPGCITFRYEYVPPRETKFYDRRLAIDE